MNSRRRRTGQRGSHEVPSDLREMQLPGDGQSGHCICGKIMLQENGDAGEPGLGQVEENGAISEGEAQIDPEVPVARVA